MGMSTLRKRFGCICYKPHSVVNCFIMFGTVPREGCLKSCGLWYPTDITLPKPYSFRERYKWVSRSWIACMQHKYTQLINSSSSYFRIITEAWRTLKCGQSLFNKSGKFLNSLFHSNTFGQKCFLERVISLNLRILLFTTFLCTAMKYLAASSSEIEWQTSDDRIRREISKTAAKLMINLGNRAIVCGSSL